MATQRLADKVAIITGAGSGLGRAATVRFAAEGALVVCADVDAAAAASAAKDITDAGGRAVSTDGDVATWAGAQTIAAAALDSFGRVDVLFANAGIAGVGTALDTDEDLWQRVIDIDLKGVWLCAKAVLPHMIAQGSGSIVNTASVGGLVGIKGIFSYAAAKGGVVAMTKQMAVEYGPSGIRVNAICPGTVMTPLVESTYRGRAELSGTDDVEAHIEQGLQAMRDRYPLGALGDPSDIAAAAAYLASDDAKWVTGTVLTVDGGITAA